MLAPENESDEKSKSKLPDAVKAGKWQGVGVQKWSCSGERTVCWKLGTEVLFSPGRPKGLEPFHH